jgi:hypothetical protein
VDPDLDPDPQHWLKLTTFELQNTVPVICRFRFSTQCLFLIHNIWAVFRNLNYLVDCLQILYRTSLCVWYQYCTYRYHRLLKITFVHKEWRNNIYGPLAWLDVPSDLKKHISYQNPKESETLYWTGIWSRKKIWIWKRLRIRYSDHLAVF